MAWRRLRSLLLRTPPNRKHARKQLLESDQSQVGRTPLAPRSSPAVADVEPFNNSKAQRSGTLDEAATLQVLAPMRDETPLDHIERALASFVILTDDQMLLAWRIIVARANIAQGFRGSSA
jgi:hypothetical protein